jgi:cell wall-associated NlpC family hydrolase
VSFDKVVEVARKEVGYVEGYGNKTKYGKWFGFDGVPWCAMFVSWCYHYAGRPLGNIGWKNGFAGCQIGYEFFKKHGWITDKPEPGDIILYDFNGDKRYDHTGIFVKWIDDCRFEAIEGNTSTSNQNNGGQVMVKDRKNVNVIFVCPKM